MTRFVVDLGNLKLTNEQKHSIESSIHEIVLSHLAEMPEKPRLAGYFPPEWLGFILRERLDDIVESVADIGKFAKQGR